MTKIKTSPWHCPKCGQRLILKDGRYGRFMACPSYPDCRYTRAMWTYQKEKPYCDKCNNTGLIPFIKKDGTVSSYAKVFCDCHEDELEYDYPISPEDFDFPMSYDFRSFIEERFTGKPLPALEPKTEDIQPENIIVKPTFIYFKNDIRALELNKRVTELENFNQYLLKKEKDLMAKASKRKRDVF